MLKLENCRERQERLLEVMEKDEIDLAVLTNPKTIYYFSGALVSTDHPHAFLLNSSGKSVLVTQAPVGRDPEAPDSAADETDLYTFHSIDQDVTSTTWSSDVAQLTRKAAGRLAAAGDTLGLEFESANFALTDSVREWVNGNPTNLTPAIDQMRRQKDPDEIECMRGAVALVEAGLAAVKSRLEPGMTEYRAYSIYYEGMVAQARSSVAHAGDFACGLRAIRGGGPPTDRKVQLGDLYIFDTFPTYEGYMCDFTRTFVVGRPTQIQQDAWGHVMEAHEIARRTIAPDVPARDVYLAIKTHLDKFEPAKGSFWHHAGHGVGMSGWERPWLTPGSEEVIQDREVLACEPGLYAEAMQGGIRLEHNYLVTPEGVTALDHFPMDLT
jgi:Xaa-Pro aminopeptidase